MDNFNEFLAWERHTRDTIDFKKAYVDVAGDVLAGLVLSEIVYWHLPNNQGKSKLRVVRNDKTWIACTRYEWWDRTRLTPRQIDRLLKVLVDRGIIEKDRFRFEGSPTVHVHLKQEAFVSAVEHVIQNPLKNPFLPNGENAADLTKPLDGNNANGEIQLTASVKSLTETTTETTKKEREKAAHEAQPAPEPEIALSPSMPEIQEPVLTLEKTRDVNPLPIGEVRKMARDAFTLQNTPDPIIDAFLSCFKGAAKNRSVKTSEKSREAAERIAEHFTPEDVIALVTEKRKTNSGYPFGFLEGDLAKVAAEKESPSQPETAPGTRTDGYRHIIDYDENYDPIYGDKVS